MPWPFDSVSPTGSLFCLSPQRLCLGVSGGDARPVAAGVDRAVLTVVCTLVS